MKIQNVRVYGLEESILASAYPMKTETYNWDYRLVDGLSDNDMKRAVNLGSVESGSGHDCALKGIIVQYDLTAPEYFWRQFDRYHFHDYISSQSKMHCLLKFDIAKMCNAYVDKRVIDILKEKIEEYNGLVMSKFLTKEECNDARNKKFQEIISNTPMGFELTARITDNYLQLKSKRKQRRNHKLEEWQYYCDWIESLPSFKKIVLKEE